MSESFSDRRHFGNPLWLWFIRGTVALAWVVGSWAIKTLLAVDKNQTMTAVVMTSLTARIDKLEARNDERDKEERERLYMRGHKIKISDE